jgi:hypothetical protein
MWIRGFGDWSASYPRSPKARDQGHPLGAPALAKYFLQGVSLRTNQREKD